MPSFVGGRQGQPLGLIVIFSYVSGVRSLKSGGIGRFLEFFGEVGELFLERSGVNPELLAEFLVSAALDFARILVGLFLPHFVLYFSKVANSLLQLFEFLLERLELLIGLLLLLVGVFLLLVSAVLALQEPDAQTDTQDQQHRNQERPIA